MQVVREHETKGKHEATPVSPGRAMNPGGWNQHQTSCRVSGLGGQEVPAGFWVLQIRCSSLDVRHYLDLDKVRLFLELTFVQPQLVSTEIFGFRLLRRALLPKQTFSFSWLRGLHAAIVTSPFGLISMTPLMCVCVLLGESEFFMFSMFHTSLGRKISACRRFAFLLRFWWGSKSEDNGHQIPGAGQIEAKSGIGSGTRSSSRS